MIRRLIKWIVGIALLLAIVVLFVLPYLASTEAGRNQLAKILSRALDREVTIGGLEVGFLYTSVDIEDLRIANPEGFPEGAFLHAKSLELDSDLRELLKGTLHGRTKGDGFVVHILRKGGRTNLEGLAPKGGSNTEGPKVEDVPDLDLAMEIQDSRLIIEDLDKNEKLVLDGCSISTRLTNREGDADAGLEIRVRSIERGGLEVRELEMDSKFANDSLEMEKLHALLPGRGTLCGTARLRVKGGDDWSATLLAKDVGLDDDIMEIVGALYPLAAAAKGQTKGTLDSEFEVKGNGLTWDAMKPTLAGTGRVTFTDLALPADSVIGLVAALAGREGGDISINDAGAQFRIADGWLDFQRLSASTKEARYDLAGRVSLDGELDLNMDLMPLVKTFGGGKNYKKVSKYVKRLPVRIVGTSETPRLKAPRVEDIATDAAQSALEDLFKKKK